MNLKSLKQAAAVLIFLSSLPMICFGQTGDQDGPRSKSEKPESKSSQTLDSNLSNDDIISQLEAEMEEISQTKRTKQSKEQRARLAELKAQLKVAETINKQLVRTRLSKSKENRGSETVEDFFLIATIQVARKSNSADIRFETYAGETGCTDDLFEYFRDTPKGGFRDYRIMGRYINSEQADLATKLARKEYDTMKEREQQMIAYIQARNRAVARIKASRRC